MTSRLSATLPLFLLDPHPWQLQWLQVQLVPPLYRVAWLGLLATCILCENQWINLLSVLLF